MAKAVITPRKCAKRIAFIVADDTDLDADTEATIVDRIHGRIADVDLFHEDDIDSGNANLEKYDLVLVSKQITNDSKVDELVYLEVPIISFKGSISSSILGIGGTSGTTTTVTNTNITDKTHNVTRERDTGSQAVYKSNSSIDYIGGIVSESLILAEDPSGTAKIQLIVADCGGLVNQFAIPTPKFLGTRIHFGYYQINELNAVGQSLFDESVRYALCKGILDERGYFSELLALSNDMTPLTITSIAANLDIVVSNQKAASPTITDDKKVRKIMLIVECWLNNMYDGSNWIGLTNPAHNQWQLNLDGGAYSVLEPDGQMQDRDWTLAVVNSHLYQRLIFDVTELITNIDGKIGVRLQNAKAKFYQHRIDLLSIIKCYL